MNLTTTARFKTYAGISGSGQDALVDALLPQVSEQIAQYLRRDLEATTYRSWLDGTGGPLLRLTQWPILTMYQMSIGAQTVGRIWREADTASRATVSFDGATLLLAAISTAGVDSLEEIAVASYKTLSSLETTVEAKTSWMMELDSSDYGQEPSLQMNPIRAQAALFPDRADIQIPNDPEPVQVSSEDTIDRPDGGLFPIGIGNVFVWYKAGYTLPTDDSAGTLPAGLELIVQQILMDVMGSVSKNSNLQSESLGDYSYSLRSGAGGVALLSAIENRKKDLNLYRRVTI